MLYTLVVLAGLFNYIFAAPLSSCEAQAECIDLRIEDQGEEDSDGNALYEICLVFDATLDECVKDESDSISHACVAGEDGEVSSADGEKIEGLDTGDDAALCDIIPCGGYTTFGLKDGRSCELDGDYLYANLSIPNYDQYLFCYSGMSCNANGKNDKACKWAVFAPDCEDDGTTTTDEPDDATSTTPETPDYPPEEECVCQFADEAVVAEDVCNERCDGSCFYAGVEGGCQDPPSANPARVYNRARAPEDEFVTVPETETEGGDDTPTTASNNEGGAGVINLLPIVSIVVAGLYVLQ